MTSTAARSVGVSVVMPVRNGAPWLRAALDAVFASAGDFDLDVIAVEDGSTDGSLEILEQAAAVRPMRVLAGPRRGAAAAMNAGIRAARHPLIAQIDQDVVVSPSWLERLVATLDDPAIAAVQGRYALPADAGVFARVTGVDLEWRYAAMRGDHTDQVCTGNAIYRASALHQIGLFDESLGYGYDNDLSYRLRAAGYGLRFCREARSIHHWREGLRGYCRQQYGLGYGRIDLVAKHPRRATGDAVSPTPMMLHPIAMAAAIATAPFSPIFSLAIVAMLAIERTIAGVRASRFASDRAGLLFPVVHLLRDVVWVWAMARWAARRLRGAATEPSASMAPRSAGRGSSPDSRLPAGPHRVLGLIPAHNEAATLPHVVAELRAYCPDLDVLVLDDGSTDDTQWVLQDLGVRFLHFPDRMGIGSAMRAGLRYAARMGYDGAVRLDGDGQHDADEIERLLAPLRRGFADVSIGSRYSRRDAEGTRRGAEDAEAQRGSPAIRFVQRSLAVMLSIVTGRAVTDPTSGFCAFGPRAVRFLAEHHPTGYPEPELLLLLNRNRLSVIEVAVSSRPRLAGRTSLTLTRLATAAFRVMLAIVIVPLRATAVGSDRD